MIVFKMRLGFNAVNSSIANSDVHVIPVVIAAPMGPGEKSEKFNGLA